MCVPLDKNKEKLRQDRYVALTVGLKRIYPDAYTIVPNYLGVFFLYFSHLGGKTHLGGTDRYLGGITPWAFWDIHMYHIFEYF